MAGPADLIIRGEGVVNTTGPLGSRSSYATGPTTPNREPHLVALGAPLCAGHKGTCAQLPIRLNMPTSVSGVFHKSTRRRQCCRGSGPCISPEGLHMPASRLEDYNCSKIHEHLV